MVNTRGACGRGVLMEYMQGRPFVALGASFQRSAFTLMALEASGISGPEGFVARTVSRISSPYGLAELTLFKKVDPDSVQFVDPSAEDIERLIEQVGSLDDFICEEPLLDGRFLWSLIVALGLASPAHGTSYGSPGSLFSSSLESHHRARCQC